MARLVAFPPGATDVGADFAWACAAVGTPGLFAELDGSAFGGSFDGATQWLREHGPPSRALVAIFARGDGMEAWLAGLNAVCPGLPVAGGAAARLAGSGRGGIVPPGDDVALFAIGEGTWRASALTAHRAAGDWVVLAGGHPRRCAGVASTGEQLAGLLERIRRTEGLPPDDWDRIALTDRAGVVYHLHQEGDEIVSGADLCPSREVAPAVFHPASLAASRAALDEQCLVFGCAGLAGLRASGLPWAGCGPFTALYGEIHPCGGTPRFSNLTLSVLERLS
jgi:hypothetical protein